MTEILVDTRNLRSLATALRKSSKVLHKEFNTALTNVGEIVAVDARRHASFSKRIPATIKTRRRGLSVRVRAGGDAAPHAAPLEHGGIPGTFRHPTWGNIDKWVSQPAHPFLTPALTDTAPLMVVALIGAVDLAIAQLEV